MTDKGLSFPQIGVIHKGAKKETNAPGKDLPYFRVEFAETEKKSAADFLATYKDQPRTLRIILPFNDIPRMWDAWYEAYTAGRMVARSDGEYIIYQCANDGTILVKDGIDVATGQPKPHPVDMWAGNDYKGNGVKFKAVGRLNVIIPELKRAAYLTLQTTSIHDITNISNASRMMVQNTRTAITTHTRAACSLSITLSQLMLLIALFSFYKLSIFSKFASSGVILLPLTK